MTALPSSTPPHAGLFDSGIGGLSILRRLRVLLPAVRCTYIADSRHAPYGGRPRDWLAQRCLLLSDRLQQRGAELIVVACNTATTQVIESLRTARPTMQFVGVEPGVKPAVTESPGGRIAVLATAGTIASPRLQALLADHARQQEVHLLPCVGLADAIEDVAAGATDASLEALLDDVAQRVVAAGVDTVVLGCTHYPLVSERLAQRLPPTLRLIDTADAVVRRIGQLLPGTTNTYSSKYAPRGTLSLLSSGDIRALGRAARLWLPDDEPDIAAL